MGVFPKENATAPLHPLSGAFSSGFCTARSRWRCGRRWRRLWALARLGSVTGTRRSGHRIHLAGRPAVASIAPTGSAAARALTRRHPLRRRVPILVPAAALEQHGRSRDRALERAATVRTNRQLRVRKLLDLLSEAMAGGALILIKRHCCSSSFKILQPIRPRLQAISAFVQNTVSRRRTPNPPSLFSVLFSVLAGDVPRRVERRPASLSPRLGIQAQRLWRVRGTAKKNLGWQGRVSAQPAPHACLPPMLHDSG